MSLTAIQRDLLVLLSEQQKDFDTISEELSAYYETSVAKGRLLPNLDTLISDNLVVKTTNKRRADEDTYQITEEGRQKLQKRPTF